MRFVREAFLLLLINLFTVDRGNIVRVFLHIVAGFQRHGAFVLVQLFKLLAGKSRRHLYFDGYVKVARSVNRFDALAADAETRPRRRAFGYAQLDSVLYAGDDYSAALHRRSV